MISKRTYSNLYKISSTSADPEGIFKLMVGVAKLSYKLVNRSITKLFLSKCLKLGLGTKEIEDVSRRMDSKDNQIKRNPKNVI